MNEDHEAARRYARRIGCLNVAEEIIAAWSDPDRPVPHDALARDPEHGWVIVAILAGDVSPRV